MILFLAFAAMASAPGTDIRMLATGLAAGILLDATVIRALIVPAVMSLDGPLELVAARAGARGSCESSRQRSTPAEART